MCRSCAWSFCSVLVGLGRSLNPTNERHVVGVGKLIKKVDQHSGQLFLATAATAVAVVLLVIVSVSRVPWHFALREGHFRAQKVNFKLSSPCPARFLSPSWQLPSALWPSSAAPSVWTAALLPCAPERLGTPPAALAFLSTLASFIG